MGEIYNNCNKLFVEYTRIAINIAKKQRNCNNFIVINCNLLSKIYENCAINYNVSAILSASENAMILFGSGADCVTQIMAATSKISCNIADFIVELH